MAVTIKEVMTTSPVMPVMVINQLDQAVPLAKALVDGGLKVLEITLRTPVALDAIRKIKAEVPGFAEGRAWTAVVLSVPGGLSQRPVFIEQKP